MTQEQLWQKMKNFFEVLKLFIEDGDYIVYYDGNILKADQIYISDEVGIEYDGCRNVWGRKDELIGMCDTPEEEWVDFETDANKLLQIFKGKTIDIFETDEVSDEYIPDEYERAINKIGAYVYEARDQKHEINRLNGLNRHNETYIHEVCEMLDSACTECQETRLLKDKINILIVNYKTAMIMQEKYLTEE